MGVAVLFTLFPQLYPVFRKDGFHQFIVLFFTPVFPSVASITDADDEARVSEGCRVRPADKVVGLNVGTAGYHFLVFVYESSHATAYLAQDTSAIPMSDDESYQSLYLLFE